ncbi:MAG: chorismate mutase [Nostoc sp. DedQUE08]|uniref:chorismate mutase n=1 Tax=Nostoc sp. DedSLP04 TaxID=3075401 RepID=UPI002AD344FF|nr:MULTISPECIES: chorismate mutase [unclassified Nostoc]MDZ8033606.1 chorismate mutase [Nostoc sp. DedSLP04]MDZ8069325.1 chorismate mutase [Nostoc sp. DedQUE08]MDZ8095709.1 chorismate mutase [Nostoc sp. DedQUE05]MDZ8130282.1 chorismate mutase [Nostoc sp. DedQUE07]
MDKLTFSTHIDQHSSVSKVSGEWRVRGLRGATTVSYNSIKAITEAVDELLNALETNNVLDPDEIVSVTFSATSDLDAMFPAAVARRRPGWDRVPLLDVQQMQVANSLDRCIRVLIHLNTPLPQNALRPVYLHRAAQLRPDIALLR